MTATNSLSLILRRLDEVESKLDRMLQELRTLHTPAAIGYSVRRGNGWGFFRPREKRVSHICVWRYVRPFVRNNNYSVCNCNRIGGFARDDKLAAASGGCFARDS